jgi:hypothetical protein
MILKGGEIHHRGHGEHKGLEQERKEAAEKRFSRFMIAQE